MLPVLLGIVPARKGDGHSRGVKEVPIGPNQKEQQCEPEERGRQTAEREQSPTALRDLLGRPSRPEDLLESTGKPHVPREFYCDFLPYFLRTLNDAFDLETHRFQNLMLIHRA